MLSRAVLLCAAASAVAASAREPAEPEFDRAATVPGAFSYLECNRGQSDRSVDFLARCGQYTAWVRSQDVVVALPAAVPIAPPGLRRPSIERDPPHVLDIRLVGAAARAAAPGETLPGASNYFIGRDESRWVTDAPHVSSARYADSWPGVDVVWSLERRRLHAEFEVAAGADPVPIAFAIDGASRVRVAGDGSLRVTVPAGEAALSAPAAYQPGGRRVDVRWEIRGDGSAGFALGSFDRRRPLRIDPSLTYSTFVGGSGDETAGGVAVDSSGNAYVAGMTFSSNLPVTTGTYQSSLHGSQDAFCIKFNSSGSTLGYCTYIGGSIGEIGTGIAVDSSGNAYIGGQTGSSDFPVTSGAAVTSLPGYGQFNGIGGFVVKLNSSGNARSYATYVGNGYLTALALDSSGSVYVAQDSAQIGVYKLNANGTSFSYTTSYGVTYSQDMPYGIAVDSSGNAYVIGTTSQNSFPTTTGALSTNYGGGSFDGFLFKLNSSGGVAWSTFLGGSGDDEGYGVAVDASGNPWVTGYTKAAFATTSNAYSSTVAGDADAFLIKMDPGGASIGYGTLLGGTDSDYGVAVAVRGAYVYVAGSTASTDFPTVSPYQSSHAGGTWDVFLATFQCDGVLANSTYIGGTDYDEAALQGLAADSSGDAYVYPNTYSPNFPTQNAYDVTLGGPRDGVLAKMTGLFTPFAVNNASMPAWTRGVAFTQSFTTAGAIGAVTWSLSAGALPSGVTLSSTTTTATVSGTPSASGTYTFTLRAVDSCQQTATRQFTWLVNPPPAIAAVAAQSWTRTVPFNLTMSASGGTAPLTFSVDSGTVPPGLGLDSGGVLSGTPTTAGSYSFDANVTDLRGATALRTVAMLVAEVPSIAAKTFADCTETVPYSTAFTAADGTPPLKFSFVSGGYPFTAPVDADTGAVSGKTKAAGAYQFTLRITDSLGASSDREFSILLNPSPQIDSLSLPLAATGRGYHAKVLGHAGTPPVKWQLHTSLPTGLLIDQVTGDIAGTPTVPGGAAVQFGYEDGCGGAALRALRLEVANALDLTKRTAKTIPVFDETAGRSSSFFALELIEGTSLSITVTPKQKGDFPVDVSLMDPTASPVDLSANGKLKGRSYSLKNLVVPATGRYVLRLAPIVPFTGAVSVSVAISPGSTFGGVVHLDGATAPADLRVPVLAGAKLTFTVKGAKKSGLSPQIVAVQQGGTDLLAAGEVTGSGTSRTVKLGATLAQGDVHVIVGAAAGTSGDATWKVVLKQPKTYTFNMAEVPLGD